MYDKHVQVYKTDDQHEILEHWIDTNVFYGSCDENYLNKPLPIDIEFLEKIAKNEEEAVQHAKLKHKTDTIAIPFAYDKGAGYVVMGWMFKCA
jgi:hypothetical protein